MHYEKLHLLRPQRFKRLANIHRSRIPGEYLGSSRVTGLLLVHQLFGAGCDFSVQFDADSVSPEPPAFDQCRSASEKRIQDPVALFGVAKHELMRYLRDEVPPVPPQVSARAVPLGEHPKTV